MKKKKIEGCCKPVTKYQLQKELNSFLSPRLIPFLKERFIIINHE